jgi:hypothetical protein
MNALKYIGTVVGIVLCGFLAVFVVGRMTSEPAPTITVTTLPNIPSVDRNSTAFEALLQTEPSVPLANVIDLTFADSYTQYKCTAGDSDEVALMLAGRHDGDLDTGGYTTIHTAVRGWESQMFNEIGHVLFPQINPTQYPQSLIFESIIVDEAAAFDTGMRRAKVVLGDTQAYIYTGWILNYVIFTTSEACLLEVMGSVYHPD